LQYALIEAAVKQWAMTDAQLRARVRDLMALGDLPNERPRVHQVGYGPPEIAPRSDVCLICGEPDPTVTYIWSGHRAANLHAACDALWKQERE
jgi:hypothetical protein